LRGKSRVLRRIFGLWRKSHNEELYNLLPSPNIVRIKLRMRGGACNMHGRIKSAQNCCQNTGRVLAYLRIG
jgi:hypothetical protein